MKKIISVEIDANKIIFQVEKHLLFAKKEYNESIDIKKIRKIEKIYEPNFKHNTELTCINLSAYAIINDEDMQDTIKEITLLYQIPACGYKGDLQELFDKLTNDLNMDNIEIIETFY